MTEPTPKVVDLPDTDVPLDELPERERLGTQLRRLRLKAGKTVEMVAMASNVPVEALEAAERFALPLNAEQLQSIAVVLGVQWHPLLDLTRAFHRSLWKEGGNQGGVQLEEMDTKVASMARPLDKETEAILVKSADDFLFLANVAREVSDRAITNALQLRTLLADRGVIEKDAPLELIDNPKVECAACGVVLDRNRENTVRFQPADGSPDLFFGHKTCGERWQEGEEFTCERSGLPVLKSEVQTSAPDDAPG